MNEPLHKVTVEEFDYAKLLVVWVDTSMTEMMLSQIHDMLDEHLVKNGYKLMIFQNSKKG